MMHRTIMAIEEHAHRYSNSSGGGGGGGGGGGSSGSGGGVSSRSSKKLKQKKVPQRGPGVAQLERMLEEQHKKDSILTPNLVHSTNTMSKNLAVECPTFRPTINSPTIPLPPPSKVDLRPSKSCLLRPNPSGPVIDSFRPKTLQSSKPLNRSGCELSWSSVLSPGNDNSPKLWSCEYSPEGESQQGNHNGVVFGPNVNLPNELHHPILPLPSGLQRSQQYQQSSCSSSMVNISSGISSSSSSVLNYQMEPPSNQNYYCCSYLPLWPEEVKMVGMKRPCPFSPEYPPVPAFHCKFPPGSVSLASRSPESASCSNECTASLESGNRLKREVPSGSRSISESKPRNVFRQNRALNGDFLTLAPPSTASPYQSQETHTLESTNCQGVAEEPTTCSGLIRSVQQPIFGLFLSAKVQLSQEGTNKSNCHAEVGETVDLNLKL